MAIKEPCFDTLRTKEQLGYVVSCSATTAGGAKYLTVIIQGSEEADSSSSTPNGPDYYATRAETFLASYASSLQNMSEKDFEDFRSAYISSKSTFVSLEDQAKEDTKYVRIRCNSPQPFFIPYPII